MGRLALALALTFPGASVLLLAAGALMLVCAGLFGYGLGVTHESRTTDRLLEGYSVTLAQYVETCELADSVLVSTNRALKARALLLPTEAP